MSILVFAEKPSDGKAIAKALAGNTDIQFEKSCAHFTSFENKKTTVFWGAGHFYNLKSPKDLNIGNNLKDLPYNLKTIPFKKDLSFSGKNIMLKRAEQLLQSSEYELLVFAGDAGREGLAILDRLYKSSKSKLPIEYIWKSDSSLQEIRKLWGNRLKGGDKLISGEIIDGLKEAANQRAIIDWKIGMNFSTLYSIYHKTFNNEYLKFRVGRVISPTLAMIEYRQKEIDSFESENLYGLSCILSNELEFTLYLKDSYSVSKSKDKKIIDRVLLSCLNEKEGKIIKIEKKISFISPGFGLNGANIKMAKKLGVSPKKVLQDIDSMYNMDGVLSYPRVESKHITEDEMCKIIEVVKFLLLVKNKLPPKYTRVLEYIYNNEFKTTIPIVNPKKVIEGHGAFHIRISKGNKSNDRILELITGNDNKSLIFQKILYNNLSFFLPKTEVESINISLNILGNTFLYNHSYDKKLGFKYISCEEYQRECLELKHIQEGDIVKITKFDLKLNTTKPLNRISVDSILVYMSHPEQLYKQEKLKEEELYSIIKKSEGIGQPATRENIIENMITEGYVSVKKGLFYITSKGSLILKTIDSDLKDVLLTAEIEKRLNQLALLNSNEKVIELEQFVDQLIEKIFGKFRANGIIDEMLKKNEKRIAKCKSPEGYTLYIKESKKVKGIYYVSSDDNRDKKGKALFFSGYNPIDGSIKNESICNTNNICPKCEGSMNIFKSNKSGLLYIECSKRKSSICDFVSGYNIEKDTIIIDNEFIEGILCQLCDSRIKVRKSKKNGKNYGICEFNSIKDPKCSFINEYDILLNEFILPSFLQNAIEIGIQYKGEEVVECDKSFTTRSGGLIIWKEMAGLSLNIEIIKELISKGVTTEAVRGFTSKKGSKFSAKLKLDSGKVIFHFQ